jgi:hypothetical protein
MSISKIRATKVGAKGSSVAYDVDKGANVLRVLVEVLYDEAFGSVLEPLPDDVDRLDITYSEPEQVPAPPEPEPLVEVEQTYGDLVGEGINPLDRDKVARVIMVPASIAATMKKKEGN